MKKYIFTILLIAFAAFFSVNTHASTKKSIKKKNVTSRKPAQAQEWPVTNCRILVEKQNHAGEFKPKIIYLYAKSKKRCDEQVVIQKNAHEAWIGKDVAVRSEYKESK